MMRMFAVASLPLAFVASCNHRMPSATVELIDTSLSIAPDAERAALDAVRAQIARMQRGDILVLIPITGNAENDAAGRILRLQAPSRRESYDADLRRFHESAEKQFAAWAAALGEERSRTDILGSLDAALQELAALPHESSHRLIVISDFLEDDGEYDFTRNQSLAKPVSARELATRLQTAHGFTLKSTAVCLGRLESIDLPALSPERKAAVDAFWRTYISEGKRPAEIHIDGMACLAGTDERDSASTSFKNSGQK